MPDPEPSHNISILINQQCWQQSLSYWENLINPAVKETLRQANWTKAADINILLTDDKEIQSLNKQFRGLDKATNVLSFPSFEPEDILKLTPDNSAQTPIILGDIALAFEAIQQESLAQHKPFNHHLIHLVVHGILHLLGFDHEEDEEALKMESLEIEILSTLMIPNPYHE
jgi:probable rRNA maturation factor